jgi:uncharacterized hydrophobic protein (TIGR00271 family)
MQSENFLSRLIAYFNLEHELDDFERIHETIKKDIVFKGTNLWILMFAIVVASVGLNMNSTAVIIGAMLISPLMGPINGIGYSIATYNIPLFRQSLKNFSFAVLTGLTASTVYFFLSPISTAHSELLARTSPTIYDVLIALFGGLAGIVAITSKTKGNVIPGVAIATALMPPLCTAGYGLATGQFEFFFGAFYLFTINTVFIALSSVAIAQILKFPINAEGEESHKKRINQWITVVIILVAIPSIYLGYNLVQKERFAEKSKKYIQRVSALEGNFLLKSDVNPSRKSILLVYGGLEMDEQQKERIRRIAIDFSMGETEITIQQGLKIESTDNQPSEIFNLQNENFRLTQIIREKERTIDSIFTDSRIGEHLLNEIKTIYPQIISCIYSKSMKYSVSDSIPGMTNLIVFKLKKTLSGSDKQKINEWLKTRLESEEIVVFF